MNSIIIPIMLMIVGIALLVAIFAHLTEGLAGALEPYLLVGFHLSCLWWLIAFLFNWEPLIPIFCLSAMSIFLGMFYIIRRFFFMESIAGDRIITALAAFISVTGTIGLLASTYIP